MQNRKQAQIFTIEEFKAASPLEKIQMHLLQPGLELPYELDDRLQAYKDIWAILGKTNSTMKRTKQVQELLHLEYSTALRYIKEAEQLFGEVTKVDAEIELAMMKERYLRLADKAEKAKDYDTARRCMENAEAILAKMEANKPRQQRVFAAVIFTDNPKALTAKNDDTDDIEFEEIDGEAGLLELEAIRVPAGHAAG